MGDNIKETIVNVIESEEIKSYVENLLRAQTDEIIDNIEKKNSLSEDIISLRGRVNELQSDKKTYELTLEKQKDYIEELNRKYLELQQICNSKDEIIESDRDNIMQLRAEVSANNNRILELENEKIQIIKNYDEQLSVLSDSLMDYESKFKDILNAYSLYYELSDEIKMRLKNIFGLNNIRCFIAATTEWNNVEGLWNFAKRRIVENEIDDAKGLVYLFRFLFQQYIQNVNNNGLELITPSIGERYDSDKHTILGVKTDGVVSKVLIDGIYNKSDNKVVFRSLINVQ